MRSCGRNSRNGLRPISDRDSAWAKEATILARFDDLKREEDEALDRAHRCLDDLKFHILECAKGCKPPASVGCAVGEHFMRELRLARKEYERARKARER